MPDLIFLFIFLFNFMFVCVMNVFYQPPSLHTIKHATGQSLSLRMHSPRNNTPKKLPPLHPPRPPPSPALQCTHTHGIFVRPATFYIFYNIMRTCNMCRIKFRRCCCAAALRTTISLRIATQAMRRRRRTVCPPSHIFNCKYAGMNAPT